MEKKFKLGVIGAGFMSSAIVSGILSSKVLPCTDIVVSDLNDSSLDKMQAKGVSVTKDNHWLSDNSEYVLFAVKPQSIGDVLSEIKNTKCKKFISIMAGIKRQRIKDALGDVMVARCMPNTPCSIGCGAVGLDVDDYVDEADKGFIKKIFTSVANVELLSENLLNVVTGVSGSSPAYFYMFVKGIIDSGIKHGLTEEQAKTLAVSTMIGAGRMIEENPEKSIEQLIAAVCSKGGTTIEAVKVFEENNVYSIIDCAIDACVKRAAELEEI